MKTVATRSSVVGFLYVICLLIGIIMLGLGFFEMYFLIVGIILTPISLYIVIDYFKTPKTPIMINEHNEIVLHQSITIKPEDLIDISFKRATGKGVWYKWGTVKITTKTEVYEYKYLNDCEQVNKDLIKNMHQNR